MQIKFEQLSQQLNKNLDKFYLLSGDEPWQIQNANEQICKAAKKQNFSISKVIYIENDSSWQNLASNVNNNSLFSEKQLFRVSLLKNKITKVGLEVLESLWKSKTESMLIFTCGKLAANEKKLSWIKKFDNNGTILTIWPIFPNQMQAWITNRARHLGINLDYEAAQLIASYTQNNLAAADQSLLKVKLCNESNDIDATTIKSLLFNQAKYVCFDILDPLAFGRLNELINILDNLSHDETQINILLFIILQELEEALNNDFRNKVYLGKLKIKRLEQYTRKFNPSMIMSFLASARTIEKAIKGSHTSNPWELLTEFCLNLATNNTNNKLDKLNA